MDIVYRKTDFWWKNINNDLICFKKDYEYRLKISYTQHEFLVLNMYLWSFRKNQTYSAHKVHTYLSHTYNLDPLYKLLKNAAVKCGLLRQMYKSVWKSVYKRNSTLELE